MKQFIANKCSKIYLFKKNYVKRQKLERFCEKKKKLLDLKYKAFTAKKDKSSKGHMFS